MELVFPATDRSVPDWWYEPLRVALQEVNGDRDYAFVRFAEFRARAMVLRPRKVDMVQYVHGPSGRFLYVDMYGLVFRFLQPTAKSPSGRFRASTIHAELDSMRPAAFDPPSALRADGRPALRLIHGGEAGA